MGVRVRILVDVSAEAGVLPWEDVLSPGRRFIYGALATHAPELGRQLHDAGYGPHRLRPFSFCPPRFDMERGRSRDRGQYRVGGPGVLAFTTPLEECGEAIVKRLSGTSRLTWGPLELVLTEVRLEKPDVTETRSLVRWTTRTPVIVKGEERGTFLLPEEPLWLARIQRNLVRKAQTLGLESEIEVELVHAGVRRLFRVDRSARIGALATVDVAGAPKTLAALRDWGLGEANSGGFGWIE